MKYAVIYSSKTGNTEKLAEQIRESLPGQECTYFGIAEQVTSDEEKMALLQAADVVFVGFWTDKGSCDDSVASVLEAVEDKKLFLFGTAGFGGSDAYFKQILTRVKLHVKESCQIVGTYMCQGKMPQSVRQRYEKMFLDNPEKQKAMLDNFDRALPHPDAEDLEKLQAAVRETVK